MQNEEVDRAVRWLRHNQLATTRQLANHLGITDLDHAEEIMDQANNRLCPQHLERPAHLALNT